MFGLGVKQEVSLILDVKNLTQSSSSPGEFLTAVLTTISPETHNCCRSTPVANGAMTMPSAISTKSVRIGLGRGAKVWILGFSIP